MKKSQDHGSHIKKIALRRETIARLTVGDLGRARGGKVDTDTATSLVSCKETAPTCVRDTDACV
jgi:hypothetical protein